MRFSHALASIALAVLSGPAKAEHAATCAWLGVCADWDDPTAWSCGHVPGANDDVVITCNSTPNVCHPIVNADTTIGSLTVENGGHLYFRGYTLTVNGTVHVKAGGTIDMNWGPGRLVVGGSGCLTIDSGGEIRVNHAGAEVELTSGSSCTAHALNGALRLQTAGAVLDVRTSASFTGSGQLVGEDADAQIQIASGKSLTNAMNDSNGVGFRGVMQIAGAGTFVNQGRVTGEVAIASSAFSNQGRVEADGGTLEVSSATISDTSGVNRWVVAGTSGSRLLFSTSATTLAGNFVLEKELELATGVDVYTCGQLTYNSGAAIDLDRAGGKDFRYDTFDEGSTCANPFDLDNVSGCGGTVFEVNTDKPPCGP